jgi:hypothetical protein
MMFYIIAIIGIAAIIGAVLILRQAIRDADDSDMISRMYDEHYEAEAWDEMLSDEIDKHFKSLSLRKKLREIEDEYLRINE